MKSLVVYYSLTGKTKLVAQAIAQALSATLVEITETKPRMRGPCLYAIGGFEARMNKRSRISPIGADLKQYERVFVGSPVWNSRPVPAINAFIYKMNFEQRSVVPFFTMAGDNSHTALANITAKINKSRGKVTGSFAIRSHKVSDEEMIASAKEAMKQYSS
jgi:flavodoxin